MKCPKCNTENREGVEFCRKCGERLKIAPIWEPSWRWHIKTLVIIYSVLIVLFFLLNLLLKPYMRKLPKDITPWLEKKSIQKKS